MAGEAGDDIGVNADQGSVYTFAGTGGAARTQTGKLIDSDGASGAFLGDLLGFSSAVEDSTIVAGAPQDDVGAEVDEGSVLVFAPSVIRPDLTRLKVKPRTLHRGSALPKLSRARKGTRISFRLSTPAKVRFAFAKALAGRKVGKRCRKPRRSNRRKRRCNRYKAAGSFILNAKQGANNVAFAGRLSRRRRLALARYKLTATPADSSGLRGKARTVKLRVVR